MGDGPYRVGNHSPLNVWCEPGQSTNEQVCMATSPRWAGRIVSALNEQDARSVGEQAVSDAVASAHLSGVDLPADWVETLGKVARGEVTGDDAVKAVVDGELRRRIASRIVEAWVGREPLPIVAYADALARQAMEVVAPALRKAYLDGHDSGYAAANVPDPWAKTPAVDGDLQHQIVRSLWDAAEICLSDSQLSVMANAVISDVVAPMLAARDTRVEDLTADAMQLDVEMAQLRRDLETAVATREQATAERDKLRNAPIGDLYREIEQLHAELKIEEDNAEFSNRALHLVLGCCDPATDEDCKGAADQVYQAVREGKPVPYSWPEWRAELEAVRSRAQLAEDERDKANRQNESLARRLHLRFQNEQKLSAELAAVKAKAVVLPEDWRNQIATTFGFLDGGAELEQAAVGLVESWCGQPDTEATEQAPREPRVWSVSDVEPAGVTVVTTPGGAVFYRSDDRRWRSESVMHGQAFTWSDLVNGYPFVTEVVGDGTQ